MAGASHAGATGETGDAQCKGDYAVLTQSQFDAALSATGSCRGASDRVAVCSQDTTKLAEQCGGSCFMMGGDSATQDACTVACLKAQASPALSAACVDCYVADVGCARDHCLLKCGINPTGDECAACRVEFRCAPDFFECSGLPGGSTEPGGAGAGGEGGAGSVAGAGAGGV